MGQFCLSVPSCSFPSPSCSKGVCATPGAALGLFFLAGILVREQELGTEWQMRSCNRLCSVVTTSGISKPFRKTLPSEKKPQPTPEPERVCVGESLEMCFMSENFGRHFK